MKGFKLPKLTKEEQQEIWDNLKAGDILIHFEWNNWGDSYRIYNHVVVKRTDKGSIRLADKRLLKSLPHNYYIGTPEIQECIKIIRLEHNISDALYLIDRNKREFINNLELEDAIELKALLDRITSKGEAK